MKEIVRVEEREEDYLIHFNDDTNEGYTPTPFEMWLVEQILAIKEKIK